MKIIRPRQVCPTGALCWNSFLVGILFFIPVIALLLVMINTYSSTSYTVNWIGSIIQILFLAVTLLVGPLLALIRWRAQVLTIKRRLLAILFAAIGNLSLILGISCIGFAYGEPQMLIVWLGILAVLFAVWSLIAWPAWWWIRRTWPIFVQDGQTCPKCGHCLRGAVSGRCPECGRAFNQYELGLSYDEFNELIKEGQQQPIS